MAELFEEIVTLLESRACTRALVSQFRIESEQAASNGAVLGVPVFLDRLGEWSADSGKSVAVLKHLRSIDTSGLQDPAAAFEGRAYQADGSELVKTFLGDSRAKVVSAISAEAGISERSAAGLLAPTAWAVMASIADRYGSSVDRQSLISVLKKEQADLIDTGWGPWLDATSSETAQEGARASGRHTMFDSVNPVDQVGGVVSGRSRSLFDPSTTGPVDGASVDVSTTGNYPPPVSRNARSADSTPAPPTRPRSQTATSRTPASRTSTANGARPAASRQRQASSADPRPARAREPERARVPERVREPERKDRSRIPALLGILALFLLGAGAVYLLTQGDEDDTLAAGEEADDSTVTTLDPSVPLSERVAIDVLMFDPEGRSSSTGLAELRFQRETGEICYNVNAEAIGSPYDGHIHVGPPGVKGGIVVDFGPITNADIGCTSISPSELASILDDPAGHYVEMHDPTGDFTIRAQLSAQASLPPVSGSDAAIEAEEQEQALLLFDPNSGGASTIIESGRVVLVGEVADQATYDRLVAENADVAGLGLELINDLAIVEGAPVPSGLITIDDSVLFEVNSDELTGGSTAIADLAVLLQARPSWRVTILGHTDSSGDDVSNLELSLRRANAVRDELVGNGVAFDRLTTRGEGPTSPVADNETPEGRALNRRIEFVIDRG